MRSAMDIMHSIMVLKDHLGFKDVYGSKFPGNPRKIVHLQNGRGPSKEWCRPCEAYACQRGHEEIMDKI